MKQKGIQLENHYYSPHLRKIWGTAFTFMMPLPLMSLFYGFSEKTLVIFFMAFLCSIDVYKAIFSSRNQTIIFLSFFVTSCLLTFMHLQNDNLLSLFLLTCLPILWGAISYYEIFRILESKDESHGTN